MGTHDEGTRALEWSDALELGIPGIDAEHRQWVDLVQRFQRAVAEGRSREEVYRALVDAALYTETHFANEKSEMMAAGYPYLEQHLRLHETAREMIHGLLTGETPEDDLITCLEAFLPNWLLLHINSADRQFARWLREQAAPEPLHLVHESGRVFADMPI